MVKRSVAGFLVGISFVAGVSSPALADFDAAMRAYGEGDYATAFREFKNDGSPEAQFNLGLMYFVGNGVKQDRREAANWFRKSADQGYVTAQYDLGVMYAKGEGVEYDRKESAKWYRKAAESGHPAAQYNLA
ncbi:MAG TPA: tetratricopeptide repeat protein, partial [Geobacteraceae bacterium]|nr:tetratricopeptide repeat protein [Geobacteraceae bacterium]